MLSLTVLFVGAALSALVAVLALAASVRKRKRALRSSPEQITVGFLHPHVLAGGGGERVLWTAVAAVSKLLPQCSIIIYGNWPAGSSSTDLSAAIDRVGRCFNIALLDDGDLLRRVEIVDISDVSACAEAHMYPRVTLLLQMVGMTILGLLSYIRRPVDVMVDTANMTFALMAARTLGASTLSYVHYPTISADMVDTVARREVAVNNDVDTASSTGRTLIKLAYYRVCAAFYRFAARFVDVALANSSWTASHLWSVWRRKVTVAYPPCRVDAAAEAPSEDREEGLIVSVGQFRPEKRHDEQLDIVQRVAEDNGSLSAHLAMVGGARHDVDVRRAEGLQKRAITADIPARVLINVGSDELTQWLRRGVVGLHTMRMEHFGIGVVELMTHGLTVVAHRSGGVAADIVEHGVTGFLAEDADSFAQCVADALRMTVEERRRMTGRARESCRRFSERKFADAFCEALTDALPTTK